MIDVFGPVVKGCAQIRRIFLHGRQIYGILVFKDFDTPAGRAGDKENPMTLVTKLLRLQLELLKPFVSGCSMEVNRRGQDKLGELMARLHHDKVDCRRHDFDRFEGLWVLPRENVQPGVIFYLHGGGYIGGDLDYAQGFATTLAAETGRRAFCIAYRLAPEHPFPAALDDAVEAYRYLLDTGCAPEKIVLAGESAGGGLIYCLCLRLKELGLPLPAGLIAISPWSDLTASGASYKTNQEADPSMDGKRLAFFARCYAGDDLGNPLVSPLFGDLGGLPPSLIFAGGDEIMLDDATMLHQRLLAAGCRSSLTVTPEMWHAYILYNVKEAQGDYEKITRFCAEVLA